MAPRDLDRRHHAASRTRYTPNFPVDSRTVEDVERVDMSRLRSPKLPATGSRSWYRYYAGFSPQFVADSHTMLGLRPSDRVLDPWMGSGTTLSVVAARGSAVAGLDLNPAMAVIARGRLIAKDTEESIEPLAQEIVKHWRPNRHSGKDLLRNWFDEPTTALLRGLVRRIDRVLIVDDSDPFAKANSMSSLAAFFYVAMFEAATGALKAFGSRNPTWIKRGVPDGGTVALTKVDISAAFLKAVDRLLAHIKYNSRISLDVRDRCSASIGDSRAQPLADQSFDAVITSPPYLTRLDYVIGHLPELALLGLSHEDVQLLRRGMIGTPTMRSGTVTHRAIGSHAEATLARVREHGTYAARSYYEPNFRQYFDGMAASIAEIERVCKPASKVVLVVQDSRFKDVHIDLAASIRAMAEEHHWRFLGKKDFVSVRSIAQVNSRAHEVARSIKPVESVLVLATPAHPN